MSIQEYCAEETVLLNARKIKQQRGIQQTLYFTRLRLDLNKKTAIVIRLKYLLRYLFCSSLTSQTSSKPQKSANSKNGTIWLQQKGDTDETCKYVRTVG